MAMGPAATKTPTVIQIDACAPESKAVLRRTKRLRSSSVSVTPVTGLGLAEELFELGGRDIRAAQDERNAPIAQPVFQLEGRGQGGGACRLGEVSGGLDHQPHGGSQFGIGNQDEIVELLPQDALR